MTTDSDQPDAPPTAANTAAEAALPFTAYVTSPTAMRLAPASSNRDWMDETQGRNAYRCLPMVIANQAGWMILNGHKLAVTWDGGIEQSSLRIDFLEGRPPFPVLSHFGSGILTWVIPYLFRTPAGYNLLVRGPTNWLKDGIGPLDGIVETDWTDALFTMNWKMTRPHHRVVFDVGEPIAMVTPQRRGELEAFHPEIRDIRSNPELHDGFTAWSNARLQFYRDLQRQGSDAEKAGYQKHYVRGVSVGGKAATEHQSRLALRDFVDRRGEEK